jgi:hypothetical protein
MAKVRIHTTMTLDGFMARPTDEIDWAFKYADDEISKGIMAEIGAVMMGNSRYHPSTLWRASQSATIRRYLQTSRPFDGWRIDVYIH